MRLQAVLHKTIVFITHDFDEAIRLADRIAIMKDGEVIQIGTPEQLVISPATDYVAEFTRDVQRAKVISARSIMRPPGKATARRHGDAGGEGIELLGADHLGEEALRRRQRHRQADRRGDARSGDRPARRHRPQRSACVTVAADTVADRARPLQTWLVIWAVALALVLVLFLARDYVPWAVNYPADAGVPVADWVSAIMTWLKVNLSWLTRSITAILGVPLDFALDLLAKNFKIGTGAEAFTLPRLSWVGICAAAFLAGRAFGGWRLGALSGGLFLYIALFGKWTSAMLTLGLIAIAVPFCIVTGLFLGIWAWKRPWAEKLVVLPALDLMQTIPTFAYLIPMLLLFGNSPVSAMIATAIFATPPMVRATMLGLSRVPTEISEFSEMAGCTARQKLWRVLLPSARPTLMVGVNQVIMLALNMVIIASMIGAGGLGYDVLLALRALKVGEAMEAGLAIVALAIALDRLSQAAARRQSEARGELTEGLGFWMRYPEPDARGHPPRRHHAGSASSFPSSPTCRRRSPSPPRRSGNRPSAGSRSTSSTSSKRSASF